MCAIQVLQHGNKESQSLAATSSCCSQDVGAFQRDWNSLLLDVRQGGEVCCGKSIASLFAQRKIVKCVDWSLWVKLFDGLLQSLEVDLVALSLEAACLLLDLGRARATSDMRRHDGVEGRLGVRVAKLQRRTLFRPNLELLPSEKCFTSRSC